LTKVPLILWHV